MVNASERVAICLRDIFTAQLCSNDRNIGGQFISIHRNFVCHVGKETEKDIRMIFTDPARNIGYEVHHHSGMIAVPSFQRLLTGRANTVSGIVVPAQSVEIMPRLADISRH